MNQNFLLKQATQKLSKAADERKEFILSVLAEKGRQVAEANPNDSTAVNMYAFLSKKASATNQLYICRNELKQAYNLFYTRNNKFAKYFETELGSGSYEKIVPTIAKKASLDPIKNPADPFLTESFSRLLEKKDTEKFSQVLGKQAAINCGFEFNRYGVNPKIVEAIEGHDSTIVCRAEFETPKGLLNLLIPVEINQGKALLPSVFLSPGGFHNMNERNFRTVMNRFAGEKLNLDPKDFLEIVDKTLNKTASVDSLNDLEKKVLKIKLASAKNAEDQNAIFASSEEKNQKINKKAFHQLKLSQSGEKFSEMLTSPLGSAEFLFGKNSIEKGRNVIANRLDLFKLTGYQIKVGSVNETSTVFDVKLNDKAFKVPVKMSKMYINAPEILISNGSVMPFSKESIESIDRPDINITASFSRHYGLSSNELINIVKSACLENNKEKAEDALNVLASQDIQAFRNATEIYMNALSGKLTESRSKCTKQIKLANISGPVCGHLRMPLNEVYQDEFGECCPVWRKNASKHETLMSTQHQIVIG